MVLPKEIVPRRVCLPDRAAGQVDQRISGRVDFPAYTKQSIKIMGVQSPIFWSQIFLTGMFENAIFEMGMLKMP